VLPVPDPASISNPRPWWRQHTLSIAQCNAISAGQLVGERAIDIEHDGNRPYHSIFEPAIAHDAVIFIAAHETCEWGKFPIHQELEIADLPVSQMPGRILDGSSALRFEGIVAQVQHP
jgi:hypothetical protein